LQEGEDGTNLFEEQNESFISGDFYDELGEDYFGFRELGLDKEFDMISLSVSPHLPKIKDIYP
jgi:transcriptional activator SPT7